MLPIQVTNALRGGGGALFSGATQISTSNPQLVPSELNVQETDPLTYILLLERGGSRDADTMATSSSSRARCLYLADPRRFSTSLLEVESHDARWFPHTGPQLSCLPNFDAVLVPLLVKGGNTSGRWCLSKLFPLVFLTVLPGKL